MYLYLSRICNTYTDKRYRHIILYRVYVWKFSPNTLVVNIVQGYNNMLFSLMRLSLKIVHTFYRQKSRIDLYETRPNLAPTSLRHHRHRL